ncbi:MAG: YeeE/YedE family protein [Thermodesulfobacteriaceae bacterium]|nr:YeeE/YedE family protein [Thermodesulfobacteriaceae bacterium]MCX8042113.1 YeeE/YedE family protein [Thermodesulfobacteriaceae bacterium]MDW8136209.1 YeeE/YedE thiosulfate transporter family protein [Thermodesulfobacterium sp.]
MVITALFIGFLFGVLLCYARVNKFNTISGAAVFKDFTVVKVLATAIGIGSALIALEVVAGFTSFKVKPLIVSGVIVGGIVFGVGMAILGYCPGTMVISAAEGSLDAWLGILGGLIGGLVFSELYPFIKIYLGPNLGPINLATYLGEGASLVVASFIFGIALVSMAFIINYLEKSKDIKWFYAGLGLAFLNGLAMLPCMLNSPIRVSAAFPYVADLIVRREGEYFWKISPDAYWIFYLLLGAFVAGFVSSQVRGEFKFILLHENWKKYKNQCRLSRAIWALIGGFLIIFGARLAEGCTSGHILSGGMQIAFSSLIFGVFTLASFFVTGRFFYHRD